MIPTKPELLHTAPWQREMAKAVTEPQELIRRLDLPCSAVDLEANSDFPLRVPESFIARMEQGNPRDPLLLQVLPQGRETRFVSGYHLDPVGDQASMAVPGVIHKYRGRVLLVATASCALHCRYCFRRHFPYADANPKSDQWRAALSYIAGDSTIREVILSGGDPLLLSDSRLSNLIDRLETIPHLRRVRIHTRLPVILPSRVDGALLRWLGKGRLPMVMVIHANHPNELDGTVGQVLQKIAAAGVTLLNQSVLLKGINDRVETLNNLSEMLFSAGVTPYYLHLLDKVQGAAHFDVGEEAALSLMEAMRNSLPGYLVPRLVREREGAPAKQLISETFRKTGGIPEDI